MNCNRKQEIEKKISILAKEQSSLRNELFKIEQEEQKPILEKERLKIGKCYKIGKHSYFRVRLINNIYSALGVIVVYNPGEYQCYIKYFHEVELRNLTEEITENEFIKKVNKIMDYC